MDAQEIDFLKRHPAAVYLDVGANRGQSGEKLRRAGYSGRILSFEPISECYADLEKHAADDPLWETFHTAIGAETGTVQIGISENFVSSSILDASEEIIDVLDSIRYTQFEDVPVVRLDELLPGLVDPDQSTHLKIDTQGFERFVIEGAAGVMNQINSINAEVAVVEGYKGEMQVPEAIEMMAKLGFILVDAWSAWRHPETGDVLNFDLIFRRRDVVVPRPSTSPFGRTVSGSIWRAMRLGF